MPAMTAKNNAHAWEKIHANKRELTNEGGGEWSTLVKKGQWRAGLGPHTIGLGGKAKLTSHKLGSHKLTCHKLTSHKLTSHKFISHHANCT